MNNLDQKRVWVYQSDRALSETEWTNAEAILEEFVKGWNAHDKNLSARYEIRSPYHFALIVDESDVEASGCSIDSSVRIVRQVQEMLHCNFFERENIVLKVDDGYDLYDMNEVIQGVKTGEIAKDTLMADTLVEQYDAWSDEFFKPLEKSWLSRKFD